MNLICLCCEPYLLISIIFVLRIFACLRRHRPPQGKYELFNFSHSSLRNVVERAFGVLKQKWRILKGVPSFSPRTQKHIIIACMALHNFIRDRKLSDKIFDKCDADDEYVPPVL